MNTNLTTIVTSTPLDVLILGWIDAKQRKSGSAKTHQAYQDTIYQFRAWLVRQGLDFDDQDDQALTQIALTAQAFSSFSKRRRTIENPVKEATINQRLAILSSFYDYAIKQGVFEHNPINRVERSKVQAYASATPLHTDTTTDRLAQVDRSKLQGKRDYAVIALLLSTGRRLAEVCGPMLPHPETHELEHFYLARRHLTLAAGRITVTFEHCKGGKVMRDTLSLATSYALNDWLSSYYGADWQTSMPEDAPVWLVLMRGDDYSKPLKAQGVSLICQRVLGTSKVHTTRHTWAHAMEEAGANVSTIQQRLGHESLATTGRYLASLSQAENKHADTLSANLGIV